MKIILSSRRHHYLARVGIFLVTAALIAGMVGCAGGDGDGAPPYYELTIDSTAGGSVTTPGEGTSTYDPGEEADLVAEAEEGYRFVEWTGDVASIGNVDAAITYIIMNADHSITADFGPKCTPMVAAGSFHTVGLKVNRRVVAMGDNYDGQCNVGIWRGITQIAAGGNHTVGLSSNGTIVAVGDNYDGQCDVGGWTDIVQVAAGGFHTVGLKTDGIMVAVGLNTSGQCDVGNWTDIIQVATDEAHTVGLKSNGTVVAVGENGDGQCDVGGWTDIIQVAAG
jgi:hypothetical protein